MTTMEHYQTLAKQHGLSVSGVRYRLRTGKPLDSERSSHRQHKPRGVGEQKMCLSCFGQFAPSSKYNRICPSCRAHEVQSSIYAEVVCV